MAVFQERGDLFPPHAVAWLRRALSYAGWVALGVGLLLYILKAALALPSGYGIEEFLAFTRSGAIAAAIEAWHKEPLHTYVAAYLALDLTLFIPLYAIALLRIGYWLEARLSPPRTNKFLARRLAVTLAAVSTALLVPVDLIETLIGLVKFGTPTLGWLSAALGIGMLGLSARAGAIERAHVRWLLGIALLGALVLILAAFAGQGVLGCAQGSWSNGLGCIAHRVKLYLAVAALGALLVGSLLWLSGLQAHEQERQLCSELRGAIGETLVRSRYVLAILLLIAALLFFGGQSRDVLVGLLTDARAGSWWPLAVTLACLAALWTLSHSCWLWARVLCRVPGRDARSAAAWQPQALPNPYVEDFAKYWARSLGLAPLVVFGALAAMTLHDLVVVSARQGSQAMLAVALSGLALGVLFIISRERARRKARNQGTERYFDDPEALQSGRLDLTAVQWSGPRYRFWFFLPRAPLWLPLVALGAMIVCRLPASVPNWGAPPLVFASILFAASAWMGVFGWLALLERRHAAPWVLVLIAIVGVVGALGTSDNHVVWSYAQHQRAHSPVRMWLATAVLAALMGTIGWWLVARAPQKRTLIARFGPPVLAMIALVVLLQGAASWIFAPPTTGQTAALAPKARALSGTATPTAGLQCLARIPLDLECALIAWLRTLRAHQDALKTSGRIPVYFIASEGGGARAAYWTASVLRTLHERDPHFLLRTFAISSVSGGSVGAAAFAACLQPDKEKLGHCIEQLGARDLVSSLLGALVFEDIVAQVLPTSWCATPGCGFMSRGIWFERELLSAVPPMSQSLRQRTARLVLAGDAAHMPYLFLNSTWVESGERAIASEIVIDPAHFPTARDTLTIAGTDMTLASAAHNSARFPVVNALGSIHSRHCPGEGPSQQAEPCGHVADGGYFDNSGSQTIIDLLHAYNAVVGKPDMMRTAPLPAQQTQELTRWALANLAPQVIFIHNGIELHCERKEPYHQPSGAEVRCAGEPAPFAPSQPAAGKNLTVYTDALGIAKAAVSVSGLGANRRRADALVIDEVAQVRLQHGIAEGRVHSAALPIPQTDFWCVQQRNNQVLYPLGWFLSQAARDGMRAQLADALKAGCPGRTEGSSSAADS